MIVCPNCKEEIEDHSYYCDQCGHRLYYCERCSRVGIGRRCTHCGGLMILPEELEEKEKAMSLRGYSMGMISVSMGMGPAAQPLQTAGRIPELVLQNEALNIHIVGVDGAIIGRRKGPYVSMFAQNGYVSGVHAQLKYSSSTGWVIVDKHSSNGTKLNDRQLQPDVEMSMKNGDVLTIANVNLNVSIK